MAEQNVSARRGFLVLLQLPLLNVQHCICSAVWPNAQVWPAAMLPLLLLLLLLLLRLSNVVALPAAAAFVLSLCTAPAIAGPRQGHHHGHGVPA
jgi:hypothetical protein